VGAVPGGGVLSRSAAGWFDVEAFRGAPRSMVVRRVASTTLVLGSTQSLGDFDAARVLHAGVDTVRRRSGGGAVLVGPGDPIWIDLWLPRGDPLWLDDVVGATGWVGEWWAAVLRRSGMRGLAVHGSASGGDPFARKVCFAGVGPGEVTAGGRKVVGVAQWRCREGALFHTCAYRHFDPLPLADLLALPPDVRRSASDRLARSAAGLADLGVRVPPAGELVASLPSGPAWLAL
jgi:lipoate---protein ligase